MPTFDRRSLIVGASTLSLVGSLPLRAQAEHRRGFDSAIAPADAYLPLWPDIPPGGGGPNGTPRFSKTGSLTHIANPTLGVYRPENPNGAAMLIAAGGGYRHIQMGTEAVPAAKWLNSLGITAFVLAYRLPSEGWGAGASAPFQDAQRAIRVIRARSGEMGIDPKRVGALGFSAGGHLLGMRTTRATWESYAPIDGVDTAPDSIDLNLLIYPIVTLEPPYDDTETRRVLIGDDPTPEQSRAWSVQNYVHRGETPFFLVQAADDPISNPANTAILASACQRQGVSVERHLFPSGGHGFGLGRPGTKTTQWPTLALVWMRQQRFIV